jgi:hypothetical protein
MAVKYSKWPNNIPTIPRPSKIYPNWEFWSENIPSGNPVLAKVAYNTISGGLVQLAIIQQ